MKKLLRFSGGCIAIMVLCLSGFLANAQTSVSGVVTSSEDGEGVPGATVIVKGTTNGTITDIEGNYTLSVPSDATLQVSFVGFETMEIPVSGRSVIDVVMDPDFKQLEEVVVVGYGTLKKSDVTGALSSVKAEDIAAFPVQSALQGLQGRAAGVQIQSANGGEPGAELSINIRGSSSINSGSDPLIVVDGFVGAEMPPPEDIASMEILKDASATAIYGSRATNGVILVSTKEGAVGKVVVTYTGSYSFQQVSNRLDLLNTAEFADYIDDFGINYTVDTELDTDWQDEIYQLGSISNHQLSLSGGSEDVKYYISATAFEQEGIIINSDFNRYSVISNLKVKASERVNVGLNLLGRATNESGIETQEDSGGSTVGVIGSVNRFEPDNSVYDAEGNYNISKLGDAIDNPIATALEDTREQVSYRLQANTFVEINFLDWLSFKTTLGANVRSYRDGQFRSSLLQGNQEAFMDVGLSTNVLTENYFTINKDFGSNRINWVNGYSYQKRANERLRVTAGELSTDLASFWGLETTSSATVRPQPNRTESILTSYYSRLNYTLLDRYVLTATARYDGASNFAENNKWAFFPSGAIAWNVIDESFMSSADAFSDLKLRASYGLTGNQGIGALESQSTWEATYSNRIGSSALLLDQLGTPNLTWETTSQLDVGLDIGLFDNRINASFDYYEKVTTDLLFERQIPTLFGDQDNAQLENVGEVRNYGVDAIISTRNLVGEFKWSSDIVFSLNRNEVVSLPDSTILNYGGGDANYGPGHLSLGNEWQRLVEGEPIGVFYGYVYEGVAGFTDVLLDGSQGLGGEQFADLDGDGVLTTADRQIIGDPNPDFIWSINNTLSYKNFDMNIFIQAVHGQDIMNLTRLELETMNGTTNTTTAALDRFDETTNPFGTVPEADGSRAEIVSSRWVEDGSFIRLKNVTIGYSVPEEILEKVLISSCRFYVSGQNLLTFTSYSGLDPEVSYGFDDDVSTQLGVDYASYPNIFNITAGVQVKF